MTTYELRDYRRQLERAVTFFDSVLAEQDDAPGSPVPDPGRPHDASALTPRELERTRRELQASLALARPGSSVTAPILASLTAIDTELAAPPASPAGGRGSAILLCSCGFGTSNRHWLDGHLFQHPGHHQRPQR